MKRTIRLYLDIPHEEILERNNVQNEIRGSLDYFQHNDKGECEKIYKECIEALLEKFIKITNPSITSTIDILGLIIYLNNNSFPEQIIYCCKSRKLYFLGWYMLLIRAIVYDVKEIVGYLLFLIQIPEKRGQAIKDRLQITSPINCINRVIGETKLERESVKISFKFPIRIAIQRASPCIDQYLEWMLEQHKVSHELVYWCSLKIEKIPEKIFEIDMIRNAISLNLSHNLLRSIPKHILNLSCVEKLDLSHNHLTNRIPCQILTLYSLKSLNLSHNESPGFTQNKNEDRLICQSLGKLFLNNNKIKEISNDMFISRLSTVNLSNNQLTEIPTFLAKSVELAELDIRNNPRIKNLPYFLGDCKNLEKIQLDLEQFPSLSVSNSHSSNERRMTSEIIKCIRGSRQINATKIFCIGEDEEIRMKFLRRFLDRSNFTCEDEEKAFQLINWENPRIADTHWASLKLWNVRNHNIEVMSEVLKKLCHVRSLIFIVVDFEQGISKSVEEWIEEISKMYPSYQKDEFPWLSWVTVIAYNIPKEKNDDKIKISEKTFSLYRESQISSIRDRILSGKFRKLRSSRQFYNYISVEEDIISSEYSTIFRCFIGNTINLRREQTRDKIISIDTFIHLFKGTPALELVESLKETDRIEDFLNMMERFGLIEYIKELRDTPIVLDLGTFYNTLVDILNEEKPYIKSGLLVLQNFVDYIREHPYPFKPKHSEDYILLLRKVDMVVGISPQLYIIPSRLPKLTKEIDIEQFFSAKPSEKIKKNGYIHRIFLITQMSDDFCNRLIVDILYQMRLLQVTINGDTELKGYSNSNSYNGEDIMNAISAQDMEFASDDGTRLLSIWKDHLIFQDSKNEIKVLLRAYDSNGGVEIVFARDRNKIGESFLFRVKTILYNQQKNHRDIKDILAIPHKTKKDETNPFLVDSFYKLLPIFEKIMEKEFNEICEISQGWMSEEILAEFAPDLQLEKNFQGHTFTEMPYDPKSTKLGRGVCSTVYKGTFLRRQVAVKEFLCNDGDSKLRVYHEMFTEAKMLLEYRHSCLIDVIGVSSFALPRCFMVLTFAPFGDLKSFLKYTLKPRILYLRIAQQMAVGIDFLHTHVKDVPLIHHDLKPENILVFSDQVLSYINVKIADFNFSKYGASKDGTQGYRAPEIISQNTVIFQDYKIDVFSYAVVIIYLITGRNPYREMGTADTTYTIKGMRPELNWQNNFEKGIVSLLPIVQACWSQDPKRRPEMRSVVTALSSPSLQFLYSNRSLPQNSSYNPIKSCTAHLGDKEVLCYAFSTTFQGPDLYTRVCYYDAEGDRIIDMNNDDFCKNKLILQMSSHNDKIILTLKDVGQSFRCYIALFKFIKFEMTLINKKELDEEIFQVKTMCVDEKLIYLTLESDIYIYQLKSLNPGGIIRGIIDHPIECIISLGNELWISASFISEKPSLKMRILCKETFNVHRIEQETEMFACVSQMVPAIEDSRKSHQATAQVWCLDSYRPHIYIFDSIKKKQIFEFDLTNFLPEYSQYSQGDEKNRYKFKSTKMCASSNTMWVSTQFGCILVFSIGPKKPELLTVLDVFQGPIVFLSQLQLSGGSFVACCGQVSVDICYSNI